MSEMSEAKLITKTLLIVVMNDGSLHGSLNPGTENDSETIDVLEDVLARMKGKIKNGKE